MSIFPTIYSDNKNWQKLSEKEKDGIKQWVIENFSFSQSYDTEGLPLSEHPVIELNGADLEDAIAEILGSNMNILFYCKVCGDELQSAPFPKDPLSHMVEEHFKSIPESYKKGKISQKLKRPYQKYELMQCPLCKGSHKYAISVHYNKETYPSVTIVSGDEQYVWPPPESPTAELSGAMRCPFKDRTFIQKIQIRPHQIPSRQNCSNK